MDDERGYKGLQLLRALGVDLGHLRKEVSESAPKVLFAVVEMVVRWGGVRWGGKRRLCACLLVYYISALL